MREERRKENMSDIQYSPDKPKDCKYCYWYYKRKGCTYGDHCYYEVKPKEKESPCDGCPYGVTSPCIGYCVKELLGQAKV